MKQKILVIEDDEEIRDDICELLELKGFEIVCTENGKLGIQKAREELPDLILSDILMPDADGYEVFETLQKFEETQLIPFIFLTAKADLNDIRAGMSLGADDYIVKPFSAQDLLNSVKTRLEKFNKIRNLEATGDKKSKLNYNETILVKSGVKPQVLNVSEIRYLKSANQYTNICIGSKRYLTIRKTLKEWEQILPQKDFLRIHRSFIINLHHVEKIEKWFNKSLVVKMKDDNDPLPISQRYATKIREVLY